MPKMAGFSDRQKEAIRLQAINFWEISTQRMSGFFALVNEFERLSRCLLPTELDDEYAKYPDRSALVPGDIYLNLNSIRSIARRTLFHRKPYLRFYHAGHPNLRDDKVTKAEQTVQSTFDMDGYGTGFVREADKSNYQAFYAGLCAGYTEWYVETRRKALRRPEDHTLVVDPRTGYTIFVEEPVAAYPRTKSIDVRRLRLDHSAAEVKDIRIWGCQHLEQFSELAKLNRDKSSHYNFDELKLKRTSFQPTLYFEYTGDEGDKIASKGVEEGTYGDKPIEVWTIRGIFRVPSKDASGPDDWEARDLLVEIGNRTELLALKENDLPIPGWELLTIGSVDEHHSRIYAPGLVEPMRDAFIEMFIKRNQSLDSANRNVYLTYIGDKTACNNIPEYIESANDQLLKIDVVGAGLTGWQQAIGILPRPQLGQDTFAHSQTLKREIQQGMRLSDYLQGLDPETSETATGVNQLSSSGKNQTEHLLHKLADTYYGPIAVKHLILWNFFNADRLFTIIGTDGQAYEIAPGEIDLPFFATVESNVDETNPAMVRRFVEVFPMLVQDPYYEPRELRETLNLMLELPNRDRLLPPDDLREMQIDRENAALGYGIELPVHPMDHHPAHIQGHLKYREFLLQQPPEALLAQGVTLEALDRHIAAHVAESEKMQKALGNTKEMGGNSANLLSANVPAMNPQPQGATGNYTAKESR